MRRIARRLDRHLRHVQPIGQHALGDQSRQAVGDKRADFGKEVHLINSCLVGLGNARASKTGQGRPGFRRFAAIAAPVIQSGIFLGLLAGPQRLRPQEHAYRSVAKVMRLARAKVERHHRPQQPPQRLGHRIQPDHAQGEIARVDHRIDEQARWCQRPTSGRGSRFNPLTKRSNPLARGIAELVAKLRQRRLLRLRRQAPSAWWPMARKPRPRLWRHRPRRRPRRAAVQDLPIIPMPPPVPDAAPRSGDISAR